MVTWTASYIDLALPYLVKKSLLSIDCLKLVLHKHESKIFER